MRAILPIAGNATRLRPLTDNKPKALVEVAGKPVLEHIMNNLAENGINELVLIVGHMKEMLIDWIVSRYDDRFTLHFVEQTNRLGLGHAIHTASEYLDNDEVLIMLGDEILSKNYSNMIKRVRTNPDVDAAVGTMVVNNPSHYGMLTTNEEGFVTLMVEKPQAFDGNLALAGVYYFKRGSDLRKALEVAIARDRNGREHQLTDALQLMVETDTIITTFTVGEGYDCGRPDSLLKSNRRMLVGKNYVSPSAIIHNSEIIQPCHICDNVEIYDSRIGPFASIGRNAVVRNSVLSDVIVESSSKLVDVDASYSLFTEHAFLRLEQSKVASILNIEVDSMESEVE
jgi:glucose-1-phosphate thymidylyltransferase